MANGWTKYEAMVLKTLDKQDKSLYNIESTLVELQKEVAALKVKAAIWGGITGAVVAILIKGALTMAGGA